MQEEASLHYVDADAKSPCSSESTWSTLRLLQHENKRCSKKLDRRLHFAIGHLNYIKNVQMLLLMQILLAGVLVRRRKHACNYNGVRVNLAPLRIRWPPDVDVDASTSDAAARSRAAEVATSNDIRQRHEHDRRSPCVTARNKYTCTNRMKCLSSIVSPPLLQPGHHPRRVGLQIFDGLRRQRVHAALRIALLRLVNNNLHDLSRHVLLYLLVRVPSFLQPVVQYCVIRPQHENEIKPSLREESGRVVLDQHAASARSTLELVNDTVLRRLVDQIAVEFIIFAGVEAFLFYLQKASACKAARPARQLEGPEQVITADPIQSNA